MAVTSWFRRRKRSRNSSTSAGTNNNLDDTVASRLWATIPSLDGLTRQVCIPQTLRETQEAEIEDFDWSEGRACARCRRLLCADPVPLSRDHRAEYDIHLGSWSTMFLSKCHVCVFLAGITANSVGPTRSWSGEPDDRLVIGLRWSTAGWHLERRRSSTVIQDRIITLSELCHPAEILTKPMIEELEESLILPNEVAVKNDMPFDILLIDTDEMRLVKRKSNVRFLALSYVWGAPEWPAGMVYQTKLATFHALQKRDGLKSGPLPAVVRDAITVVRSLGERYLWVDSFSIVQDEKSRKAFYIKKMDEIYANSVCTIVAASGSHANVPLPGVEPGSRPRLTLTLGRKQLQSFSEFGGHSWEALESTQLYRSRAWTFQEVLLSARLLVFTEVGIFFYPKEGKSAYDGHWPIQDGWSWYAFNHMQLRYSVTTFAGARFPDWLYPLYAPPYESSLNPSYGLTLPGHHWDAYAAKPSNKDILQVYEPLVEAYGSKDFTYTVDILDAWSGIASRLSRIVAWSFIYGLPVQMLHMALLWRETKAGVSYVSPLRFPTSSTALNPVAIPSWSWISRRASVTLHHIDLDSPFRSMLQNISVYDHSLSEQLALPTNGEQYPFNLSDPQNKHILCFLGEMLPLYTFNSNEAWPVVYDQHDGVKPGESPSLTAPEYLIAIAEGRTNTSMQCLIVVRDNDGACYRRIGQAQVTKRSWKSAYSGRDPWEIFLC